MQVSQGLHTIAILEAAKGAIVLFVGIGLFSLMHHDLQALAETLVRHTHLNPASRHPHVFIELVSHLNSTRLWQLAAGAFAYATVRFIEAYGLWRQRAWGQWFAAASGAVYVPFEVRELIEKPNWIAVVLFALNLGIVIFMIYSLRRREGVSAHDLHV